MRKKPLYPLDISSAISTSWLERLGQFPNGRVIESEDDAMMGEERRLFYVAITRAKDELCLSYPLINPKSYTGDIIQRPSRFLSDFPKELVEGWQVASSWDEVDEPF